MVALNINGTEHQLEVAEDMPLLWAMRDIVGLTGTKFGCGQALCGACTVHLDGVPMRSCQTFVGDAAGAEIATIEGVNGKVAETVQTAWAAMDVPQCGYCQSGQIMSAVALLTEKPKPTDDDIDAAMRGNLCRCATYHRIRGAIHEAAASWRPDHADQIMSAPSSRPATPPRLPARRRPPSPAASRSASIRWRRPGAAEPRRRRADQSLRGLRRRSPPTTRSR